MMDLGALPELGIDPTQPFAVLADLHANIEAVTAVAECLDKRGIRDALVLGDLIGYGASPQETLDFVREHRWRAVRGNHEDMLLDLSHVERTRSLKPSARKALEWTRFQIDSDSIEQLAELPLAARLGPKGIAVHGSLVDPRHCYAYIYEFSAERNADLLRALAPPAGTIVWFGHTHQRAVWVVRPASCVAIEPLATMWLSEHVLHLVNPGSVGFPRDGDYRSAFVVYDPTSRRLELLRAAYDIATAAKKIRQGRYDETLADRLLAAR